jgi:hypothetical protein
VELDFEEGRGSCWAVELMMMIILPLVLYACETLSLTLREEQRLRVFENRAPKKDF